MTPPANGITAEVFREVMPPYELSADLLAAAFVSIPPPPRGATQAWRQERAGRLVQEIAGLMPADAPQARIAAQIMIVREATDDSFARVNTPGLTVEQICRLRRTGGALMNSAAALERILARHQQRPVPFFGTVLPDAIDVPALAGGGGAGSRGEDVGEAPVCEQLRCEPGTDPSPRPSRSRGEGEASPSQDYPDALGVGGAPMDASPASAAERDSPPHPRPDAEASPGVVTRLDQGPGWTLDVVRPAPRDDAGGGVVPGTAG